MAELYDLVVIGGGPGGYLAAERAGHAGLKNAVIEKRSLGGVCLNEGCIPSKALLNSAKIYDYAKNGADFGVTVDNISIDQKKVVARKNNVVKQLVSGVGMQMKRNKVKVYMAEGHIEGKCDNGFSIKAGDELIEAKRIIIASGSDSVKPPIPGVKEGLENGFVLTNREILDLEEIPAKLCIVGGGVIGLEMASYFNSVGSKVTVIEMMNKIAGPTDAEISAILQKDYAERGVDFKLGCKVVGMGDGKVSFEKDGKTESVEADKVLLSIGRRANTAGLGIENIGIATERGAIITDEHLRTNVPNVYAVGDVNGKIMLAHTAYREAEVAVNHIIGKRDYMRYNAIPSVIYTHPEVAFVGETEESAKKKGMDVKVVNLPMTYSGRYVAENSKTNGIIKLIVDQKYSRLVGVHMIGSYCSEMIYGAALMIETELKIDEIKELVFPHPTVCEVIREALFEI